MTRRSQRAVPAIEGLEGRQLLSVGTRPTEAQLAGTTNPYNVRDFGYYTRAGAHVTIEVKGPGNLYGTNVDPNGALDLVYGGTDAQSVIAVHVSRGSAPLASIKEADVALGNFTGVGGQLLGSFLAPQLDLVQGGQINMTSGVGRLQLHSIGANTQVHLRDLPQTFLASVTTASSGTSNVNVTSLSGGGTVGTTGASTSGGSTTGIVSSTGTNGTSTTGTVTGGSGASTSAGSTTGTATSTTGTSTTTGGVTGINSSGVTTGNGATTGTTTGSNESTPTISLGQTTNVATFVASQTFVVGGNGNTVTIPPGETAVTPLANVSPSTPSSYTFAGRTQTYSTSSTTGATTLTSVTGVFTPTANLISTPNPANPGPNPSPPGVLFQVGAIVGGNGTIGAGQVYGYDPTVNGLVEFNTVTGAITNVIPVGGTPTSAAGVGLGQDGSTLVVLLARGTTVQAFNASTGAPVGAFVTTSLAPYGMNAVDGVAFSGGTTVLSDSAASVPVQSSGTTNYGVATAINVPASLAQGQAVAVGSPFFTDNGFSFAGDPTGVAGSSNFYVLGAAPFNAFEAPYRQEGLLTIGGLGTSTPFEQGRAAIPNPSNPQSTTPYINFGGSSGPLTGQGPAIGSVENLLAIDQGVKNGGNSLQLVSPFTLATQGTLSLRDPDLLVALSETFHPELAGSALVDIQGNVQAFNANSASGLVLNDQGNLNLVQIHTLTNSTVIGEPLSHVNIGRRVGQDLIVTTSRSVGTRNGVTIVPGLRSLGTLRLPG
jgi:hypothetical protein